MGWEQWQEVCQCRIRAHWQIDPLLVHQVPDEGVVWRGVIHGQGQDGGGSPLQLAPPLHPPLGP
eukprot:8714413-Prorocentrum_lima.AAC.1